VFGGNILCCGIGIAIEDRLILHIFSGGRVILIHLTVSYVPGCEYAMEFLHVDNNDITVEILKA